MSSKIKNFGLIGIGLVIGTVASFQYASLSNKMAGNLMPTNKLREFSDVFNMIKTDYVEEVSDEKLLKEAMVGMVASLDPHSEYLDQEAFQELREGTEGKFVGIGIEVDMQDGFIKVVAPIEDTPAHRVGILSGDLITHINGESVKGISVDDAVKRMRGKANTPIAITIVRQGNDKPIELKLVRQIIQQQSVKAKVIEPGYAWLRISQFQEPTVKDLSKKINEIYAKEPALKGLVLDLRNDPGGVLPGAIGVSAVFLDKNVPVVTTNGQLEDSKEIYYAKPEFYLNSNESDPLENLPPAIKTVPMVVLINVGSASASEIVAGALQDYKRATILGTRSFGKGSVQTIRKVTENTGIKITTARYFTPNGRSIQAQGIVPDLHVVETEHGDGINPLRSRESDLNQHLSQFKSLNSSAHKNGRSLTRQDDKVEEKKVIEDAKKMKPVEYGSQSDFQLLQALNHLKKLPVKTIPIAVEK
jgi:carboxyl-terminal processing protease